MSKTVIYVSAPEKRPDFRLVKTFLWSDEQNVNSDGNSYNPASREWTCLYMSNREDKTEWFDVNPSQPEPLILDVESSLEYLAARVAYFLAVKTNGQICLSLQGLYQEPTILLPMLGQGFDVKAAMQRVANSCYADATIENPYPWLQEEEGN